MDLSIVIVNYNTPELVISCIVSIYNTIDYKTSFEIIVVDNNSKDKSVERISNTFPKIKILKNEQNEGFGRANNKGIKQSAGDFILLLNSDIIVLEGTIIKAIEIVKRNRNIGVLGCKMINEDGSIQEYTETIANFRIILNDNMLFRYFLKMKKQKQVAIMGAFMLFPKKVLELTKGFDPDFFFYSEEIELCNRIIKKGYEVHLCSDISVIHKGSGSNNNREWAIEQSFLSSSLLFLKVRGIMGYLLYHSLLMFNSIVNICLIWLVKKEYRIKYLNSQQLYWKNMIYYVRIPFSYSRKFNSGLEPLKKPFK